MTHIEELFRTINAGLAGMKQKPLPPLVISGFSSKDLARDIAERLGSRQVEVDTRLFKIKELKVTLEGPVRGREVVVVASASGDPNRMEKETRLLLRSARNNGAKSVTLVLPNMFYGRSDDDFDERGTAGLADTIDTFGPLCDNVIVADPHNPGLTKELFRTHKNIKNVVTTHFAYPFAVQLNTLFNQGIVSRDNLLLTYPDAGASKRITNSFREALYSTASINLNPTKKDEWAQAMASRDPKTGQKDITVTTDVTGRDIVIFEDMVDSGGTAIEIARILKEKGARSVIMFATTGLFTPDDRENRDSVIRNINNSPLDAVFITDTYNHKYVHPEIHEAIKDSPIIHVIETAPMLAAMIEAMHKQVTSLTEEYENSISSIIRGKHKLQQNGKNLAEPVQLKPNSPLWKLAA